jgi:hypothetical protein
MSDTEEAPVEAPVEDELVEMSVLDALKEVSATIPSFVMCVGSGKW